MEAMAKSSGKSRLSTTIDTDLMKQFKDLAALQGKRLNEFMEESIRGPSGKVQEQAAVTREESGPKTRRTGTLLLFWAPHELCAEGSSG